MSRIDISRLTKRFDDTVIVDELDLSVDEGEFVTLLGPSGCGKTTTLRCLAGLEVPNGGRISIGDAVVFDGAADRSIPPERRGIGMMFQNYALWPHMSVGENIAFPLRRRKVPRSDIGPRVLEALRLVDLPGYEDRPINALSGGQQQRVALARTIVGEPKVLLFDEPLSNLDAKLRDSMRVELRRLHDRIGTTSIYVTHDQIEAMTLSDRVVVMNGGQIEQMGTPNDIYERPATPFVARFLGIENLLPATIRKDITGTTCIRFSGIDVDFLTDGVRGDFGESIVGFRSDSATIAPQADRNTFTTRLVQKVYVGGAYELVVESDAGRIVLRSVPASIREIEDLTEGATVRIGLDPSRMVVLPITQKHTDALGREDSVLAALSLN